MAELDINKIVAGISMEINNDMEDFIVRSVEQYGMNQGIVVNAKKIYEALKKQIPKKVAHKGCYDTNGTLHIWNGINGVPYDLCPNCEINLCTDGRFGRDKNTMKYCNNCGQRLDWSE